MEALSVSGNRPDYYFPEENMKSYNGIDIDNCMSASGTCTTGLGYPMSLSSPRNLKLALAIAYRQMKLGVLSPDPTAFGGNFNRKVEELISRFETSCTTNTKSVNCDEVKAGMEQFRADFTAQLQSDDPTGCKSEDFPSSGFINQREYECYAQRIRQEGRNVEARLIHLERRLHQGGLGLLGKCIWTRDYSGVLSWQANPSDPECRGSVFCSGDTEVEGLELANTIYEVRCPRLPNNNCARAAECLGASAPNVSEDQTISPANAGGASAAQ
jgi:hypothetical protein